MQLPGGIVTDIDAAREFERGDALLGLRHVEHRTEPDCEIELGAGKDCACRQRGLRMAAIALPERTLPQLAVRTTAARRTLKAAGPAPRHKRFATGRGPITGETMPPRPSPDDFLDFGEEHLSYDERLANWQRRVDELATQSKVDAAFAQIRADMELSEPGYRFIPEDAHQHGAADVRAVPSTFPWWVPDHLRRKKLFDRLLADLTPERISYPTRPNAHRQRALIHAILDEVDRLAGIDTSPIRATIMRIYGQRDN